MEWNCMICQIGMHIHSYIYRYTMFYDISKFIYAKESDDTNAMVIVSVVVVDDGTVASWICHGHRAKGYYNLHNVKQLNCLLRLNKQFTFFLFSPFVCLFECLCIFLFVINVRFSLKCRCYWRVCELMYFFVSVIIKKSNTNFKIRTYCNWRP